MNKLIKYLQVMLAFVLLIAGFSGCSVESDQSSKSFLALFPGNSHDFRSVSLGMPLDSVQAFETAKLVSEDLLGLAYTLGVEGLKEPASIEYYFPENRESDALKSIAVNMRFNDPRQAEMLYRECKVYFNKRYGPSVSGSFGKESWQERREKGLMEVHLRLSELEAVLSVNLLLVAGK